MSRNNFPSSVQHWMLIELSNDENVGLHQTIFRPTENEILMRKNEVNAKSCARNCPYCITQVVSASLGVFLSKTTEIDTKRGLQ